MMTGVLFCLALKHYPSADFELLHALRQRRFRSAQRRRANVIHAKRCVQRAPTRLRRARESLDFKNASGAIFAKCCDKL